MDGNCHVGWSQMIEIICTENVTKMIKWTYDTRKYSYGENTLKAMKTVEPNTVPESSC